MRLSPSHVCPLKPSPSYSLFYSHDGNVGYREWLRVTHVCRQWRDTALNCPYLWNHIDFSKLRPAAAAKILARAKISPLHLEAHMNHWSRTRFNAFQRQLEAHISHTRHLSISGEKFQTVLKQLVSSAPALEFLSLSNTSMKYFPFESPHNIPDTLFNGYAPKLTTLKLYGCGFNWKLPLLKGLRTLKIHRPSTHTTLDNWLDALNESPQLETLILHSATPAVSEPRRAVTLPILTVLNISTSAKDCAFALAHLVLPTLTSLQVAVNSNCGDGEDVRLVIPHVARNAHGLQDTVPLQSIVFGGESSRVEFFAWTMPDADIGVHDSKTLHSTAASARVVFVSAGYYWRPGTETMVFDALLTQLPVNSISTLSLWVKTRLSKELWLRHAARLAMLKQARLFPKAFRAFRDMLDEDAPSNGPPRLPRLKRLVLDNISLTALRTYYLRDMLVKRTEHGASLETLDLRTCFAAEHAIRLLAETAVEVQGPSKALETGDPAFFDWKGGVEFFDEEEKRADQVNDNGPSPWNGSRNKNEDREDGDENDDEDENGEDNYSIYSDYDDPYDDDDDEDT